MNPMDELRAARPAYYDAPVDENTKAGELARAMAQPRQAPRRRVAVRPVLGLGLAGAAAATAVAVTISVTGNGAGTGATTPGATTPGAPAGKQIAAPATTPQSASQLLLVAAESSLKTPLKTGAYWHTDSVSGNAYEVGTSVRYIVNSTGRSQFWVASSPNRASWWVSQNLGAKPAKGEEDAWKQDGSPTSWTIEATKNKGAKAKMALPAAPGKPFGNRIDVNGKVFELAGHNVSVAELRDLPTTPAALKSRLLEGYAGHNSESNEAQDADAWLFQATAGLLADMPVKPAVRAAAFKVLAGIDGVRSLGQVTDALGRTATGIGRTENWPTGTFERQLLINPETGILLTDQIVAVHPSGEYAWAKPGTPIIWTATTEAAWTNKAPQKP
jgi:hypothetical protein